MLWLLTDFEDPSMRVKERWEFIKLTRHAFGRTALVLSGGGALGAFHLVRLNLTGTVLHQSARMALREAARDPGMIVACKSSFDWHPAAHVVHGWAGTPGAERGGGVEKFPPGGHLAAAVN